MAAVFPPTEQGMQSLVAVLKPTPKRGRGPDGGEASRDGDDAKQKMVPCSVCGLGDEMMEMFGLKRCAGCEASEESSQATTLHLPSNSEIDLAAESEMEDEQVKTGEGKGNGSAPFTTPTLSATTPLNPPFSNLDSINGDAEGKLWQTQWSRLTLMIIRQQKTEIHVRHKIEWQRSPSGSTSTPPCYRQIRQRSHSPSPAPSIPKRCIAPAPSRRLGCSKCRWSVKGCLQCCPLKHRAWKKRKLEKLEKLKVEEKEELLKTQAKKVKTRATTLVPA